MAVIEAPGSISSSAINMSDALERARFSTPLQLAWARFRRNKLGLIGGIIVLLFIFVGVAAPLLAPYPYDKTKVGPANKPPGQVEGSILGTDSNGRDFLSRMIYGARTSLQVAAGVQVITLTLAMLLGFTAAWFGGPVDFAINRFIEIFTSMPALLFQMLLILVFGGGLINVILAIAALGWMELARLIRARCCRGKSASSLRPRAASASARRPLPSDTSSPTF